MKKLLYLSPETEVHQFETETLICQSVLTTIETFDVSDEAFEMFNNLY